MEIDLTKFGLFEPLTDFEKDDVYIDLHNEFNCIATEFSNKKKQFKFSFEANEHCKRNVRSVEVVFCDCDVELYSYKLNESDNYSGTLELMYRGRFESVDGQLREVSDTGKYYYYINFFPDVSIEVFSNNVVARVKLK